MPFSLLLHGYPTNEVPVAHVQGPALQGMFLHLMGEVDPPTMQRLHNDNKYRPYTLSPLGLGRFFETPLCEGGKRGFQAFRLPRDAWLRNGSPCYVRITLLEDMLFPTFSRYFLERAEPTFRLGETQFVVTNVQIKQKQDIPWSDYVSYPDLIDHATQQHTRKISLHFLTPTSFRRGNVDLPLPEPRLVFRSYRKRFEEFYHQVTFLPDFEEQVQFYTGISYLKHIQTSLIRTKKISLAGFTGTVTYQIDRKAPPDVVFQMNLLADYAFFCGTGRKTTVGMGQTARSA